MRLHRFVLRYVFPYNKHGPGSDYLPAHMLPTSAEYGQFQGENVPIA